MIDGELHVCVFQPVWMSTHTFLSVIMHIFSNENAHWILLWHATIVVLVLEFKKCVFTRSYSIRLNQLVMLGSKANASKHPTAVLMII